MGSTSPGAGPRVSLGRSPMVSHPCWPEATWGPTWGPCTDDRWLLGAQNHRRKTMGFHGDFHSHGGTPIAGWFLRENPMKIPWKWMMTGGTPMAMETPKWWSTIKFFCEACCEVATSCLQTSGWMHHVNFCRGQWGANLSNLWISSFKKHKMSYDKNRMHLGRLSSKIILPTVSQSSWCHHGATIRSKKPPSVMSGVS